VGIVTPQQLSADVSGLRAELADAAAASALPDKPSARADLHQLILRTRLGQPPLADPILGHDRCIIRDVAA
jgi:hypothetical protein